MNPKLSRIGKGMANNQKNIIHLYFKNREFQVTFSQHLQHAKDLAMSLRKRGIERESCVGVMNPNSYEWLVLDLACFLDGIRLVVFPENMGREYILKYVSLLDIKMIYSDSLENIPNTTVLSSAEIQKDFKTCQEDDIIECRPIDGFTVVFTSGTTGIPKAILLKLSSIEHTLHAAAGQLNTEETDCNLSFLPLSVFTTRMYIYCAYLYGFDVALTTPDHLWTALVKFKPTIMQGVPYFFENYANLFKDKLRRNGFRRILFGLQAFLYRYHLPNSLQRMYQPARARFGGRMRFMVTGTAPISPEILQFYQDVGLNLYESYGLNETGVITMNSPHNNKIGSVGKVLDGYDVMIDAEGKINVRSDFLWSDGYITEQGLESLDINVQGFLCTGDIGYLDNDGFLFVTGRSNDVIMLKNGRKVNPAEIEKKLNSLSSIRQSLVFTSDKINISLIFLPEVGHSMEAVEDIKRFNLDNQFGITIRDYLVVKHEFAVENGMLTPNLKLNRRNIYKTYEGLFLSQKELV